MGNKLVQKLISRVMVILGIATLVPWSAASKKNLIGYKSLCAFAPVSSIILFCVAGFIFYKSTRKYVEVDE